MQGLTWDSSRSTGIDMPLSLVLGLVTVVGPHPISPQLHQLVSTRGHQPRSLEGLGVSWGQRWWWGPGTSRLWHPGRRIWRWRVGYRWRWAHGCWVWMISFSFPSFVSMSLTVWRSQNITKLQAFRLSKGKSFSPVLKDIDFLIEKFGEKGVAEAFVKAQQVGKMLRIS